MKKSRFTDSRIIAVLKRAEAGTPVLELCRQHGISSATFYTWCSRFAGMNASLMPPLKERQDENRRPHQAMGMKTPAEAYALAA